MNYKLSVFSISQLRKFSTSISINQQKNHYESLGLGKSATQADVKNAYYNLSKVYHPDRNQGHTEDQREQHSQKFRDITEAYEVLGNIRNRRMYDKGFLGGASHQSSTHHSDHDPLHRFYSSREIRTRPPPPGGRQPIYDFDEWSRMHYGESVKRAREVKERRQFHENLRKQKKETSQMEISVLVMIAIILLCGILRNTNNEYDVVRNILRKKNEDSTVIDK